MADATRFKDLLEAQKKLDQILQTETMKREASEQKFQEQISGIDQKFEHLTNTLAEIQLQLLNMGREHASGGGILGDYENFSGSGSKKFLTSSNYAHSPLPRIEFPRFDGTNPRAWILKCNSYFKLMSSVPDSQRVNLATMHFDGKALSWFQNLNMGEISITWEQFLEVVSARFEDLRVSNIIVEFNKLKQTGTYEEYVDRFDELKACLVLEDSSRFTEDYFIASFLSGLSEELQSFITMFQPNTLAQTIDLGRKQLHTLDAIAKKLKPPSRPYTTSTSEFSRMDTTSASPTLSTKLHTPQPSNIPHTKMLTAAEMAARREKGLCYNCDEKYVFGHRCTKRVNYVMMTEAEELIEAQKTAQLELHEVETNMVQNIEEVHISLHSIMGENGLTTMRVVGEVSNHKLDILLDTGSTLSFLKDRTAKKLGCAIHDDKPLLVRVANGQKLISTKRATDFTWTVQGHKFQFSPRLLTNEGCDLILGGDWLRVCSPIEFDYATMVFTVNLNGERVTLQALTTDVAGNGNSEPLLTNLTHEELPDFDDILAEETYAVQDKLILVLGFLIGGCSDISTPIEDRGEIRLTKYHIPKSKLQFLHQYLLYQSIKIVPVLNYLQDVAAGALALGTHVVASRINNILQNLAEETQSGLVLIAESNVESIRCKKYRVIQILPADDVHRSFKIELLKILKTHHVPQKNQEIPHILVTRLKTEPPFSSWEDLQHFLRKLPYFDPCGQGSANRGGIVMYLELMKGKGFEM